MANVHFPFIAYITPSKMVGAASSPWSFIKLALQIGTSRLTFEVLMSASGL